MYLGRYRQGEWVVLRGQKINNGSYPDNAATFPYPQYDSKDDQRSDHWKSRVGSSTFTGRGRFKGITNPLVQVFDKDFNKVAEKEMWPAFPIDHPAVFKASLFLGSDIPQGICTSITTYTNFSESSAYELRYQGMICSFEVLPGGHASGSYLAMHYFDLPHAKHVLGQHDSDTLDFRKNPKV